MYKHEEVLNMYYKTIEEEQKKIDVVMADKIHSEAYKENQIKDIYKNVNMEAEKYKERFREAVNEDIRELNNSINFEIPDILKMDVPLTKEELQLIADKHPDSYFGMKIIRQKAVENDWQLNLPEDTVGDYDQKIEYLKKLRDNPGIKFSGKPMEDTPEAILREAMGLWTKY